VQELAVTQTADTIRNRRRLRVMCNQQNSSLLLVGDLGQQAKDLQSATGIEAPGWLVGEN
jgi:hypothetical protein